MLARPLARLRPLLLLLTVLAVFGSCKTEVTTADNCGDDFLDPGEACDGAELGGATCRGLGFYQVDGQVRCGADCQLDTSGCGTARCGDGAIQTDFGENCEGTNLGGASCVTLGYATGALGCHTDTCRFDLSACVATADCGNGVIQEGEQCDGQNLDGQTCSSLGYHGGNLLCTAGCQLDTADCITIGKCGDARIQADFGEVCDGANLAGETCENLGYHGGTLSCASDCTLDLTSCVSEGRCGDAELQAAHGEECDGANLDGDTCETLGFHGGTLVCTTGCLLDRSSCEAAGRCGDGDIQAAFGETCDGDNHGGDTCETLGYYGGTITCTGDCLQDRSACEAAGWCGDGEIQAGAGETCDGTNLGGQTCALQGFWGGSLSCADCTLGAAGCLRATRVAGGEEHTCALDQFGQAWCWGSQDSGALGDEQMSGYTLQPGAVSMPPATTFTELCAGRNFSCAVDTDGGGWCWGSNTNGQLGTGDTWNTSIPVPVEMTPGVSIVSIGCGSYHTCALDSAGRISCWGSNTYGTLGDGTQTSRNTPQLLTVPSTFTHLAVGPHHNCAITDTGDLFCWGYNNSHQITHEDTDPVLFPELVGTPDSRAALAVATGYFFTCVVLDGSNNLFCKGYNMNGQLGNGSNVSPQPTFTMTVMPSGTVTAAVTAGYSFGCARTTAGAVHCWGVDEQGQTGDGTPDYYHNTPRRVSTTPVDKTFTAVRAGSNHACALDADGLIWCWGDGSLGQVGNGYDFPWPAPSRVLPPTL
jgi:alpha-tubulin suppressor-like RCC1 family protein